MPSIMPFDPFALLLIALLNPAVIAVGIYMGLHADQWQKLPIAGFVAAIAGAVLVWLAVQLGVLPARGAGGESGLFVMQFLIGTAWATGAWWWGKRRRT